MFCYDYVTYLRIQAEGEGTIIALTSLSMPAKKRILQVCVKLFLEKGYKKTTMAEILEKAEVSNSSFQNIFRAKDGVLIELTEFMFSNQFATARNLTQNLPPVCVYAAETAVQITMTELNENLREIYTEAYTQAETLDFISHQMAKELMSIFGSYLPGRTEEDFYQMEIVSGGMMRAVVAHPCDEAYTLEKKLKYFLSMSLRGFCVPEEEIRQALDYVLGIDMRALAEQVIQHLFNVLAMHYEFKFSEPLG